MKMRMVVVSMVGLSLASAAAAEPTALQQLAQAAGADGAALAHQMEAGRAAASAVPDAQDVSRKHPKDVFRGCPALEAEAFNAKQAAILVQTCLNNFFPADGAVYAQASAVGETLKIAVYGQPLSGDPVGDLDETLERRGHKLFRYPVSLDDETESMQAVRR